MTFVKLQPLCWHMHTTFTTYHTMHTTFTTYYLINVIEKDTYIHNTQVSGELTKPLPYTQYLLTNEQRTYYLHDYLYIYIYITLL